MSKRFIPTRNSQIEQAQGASERGQDGRLGDVLAM